MEKHSEYFTTHFVDNRGNDIVYIASNEPINPLDYYELYTQLNLSIIESRFDDYIQMQRYFWKIIGDAEFANLELPKIKDQSENKTIVWYA